MQKHHLHRHTTGNEYRHVKSYHSDSRAMISIARNFILIAAYSTEKGVEILYQDTIGLEDLEREATTKELIPNEIVLKIPTPDIDIKVPERIEVPGTKALKEEICESPEESISLPTNAVVIGIGLIASLVAARSSMIQRENVVEEQVKKSREDIISSIEKEYGEEAKKQIKKAFADEVWFDPVKALEILKK